MIFFPTDYVWSRPSPPPVNEFTPFALTLFFSILMVPLSFFFHIVLLFPWSSMSPFSFRFRPFFRTISSFTCKKTGVDAVSVGSFLFCVSYLTPLFESHSVNRAVSAGSFRAGFFCCSAESGRRKKVWFVCPPPNFSLPRPGFFFNIFSCFEVVLPVAKD